MPEAPDDLPTVPSADFADAARQPSRVAALADHPAAAGVLAGGLALLLWASSQIPQSSAPWPATDGLSRSDLQALSAVGLDSTLTGAPALLLAVAAIVVLAARTAPASSIALLRRVLAGLAALGLAVAIWTTSGAPRPTVLEVPLDAPAAALNAYVNDAGRWAAAGSRWHGRCERQTDALRCTLDGAGAQHAVQLQPGVAAGDWLWLGAAQTPLAAQLRLHWHPANSERSLAIPLRDRQTVDVAALERRMTPVVSRTAGPLVLVAHPEKPDGWLLAGPPSLHPAASRVATLAGTDVALVQYAPGAGWLARAGWWLALAAGVGALLLAMQGLAVARTPLGGLGQRARSLAPVALLALTAAAVVAPSTTGTELSPPGAAAGAAMLGAVALGLAVAAVWLRASQGALTSLLFALLVVWLPLGVWGGPWPQPASDSMLIPAAATAASHVARGLADPRAGAAGWAVWLLGAWPLLATALVAGALARPQHARLAAGGLGVLTLGAVALAQGYAAADGQLQTTVLWGLRGAFAAALLARAAGQAVEDAPSSTLLQQARLGRAAVGWLGAATSVLLLPAWLGPLWWREPQAAGWLALAVAGAAGLHAAQRAPRLAAALDGLALAAALTVAGGSRLGAAVSGALP